MRRVVTAFSRGFRAFFSRTLRAIIILTITFSGVLAAVMTERASAACPGVPPSCVHMLLFWDGGAMPNSDWEDISGETDIINRFPRGDTVANFGGTAGTNNHVPTVASVTNSTANGGQLATASATPEQASNGHTHPTATVAVENNSPSVVANNNNVPAYRTLQLMRYKYGIPNEIPAGAIALFDDTPGLPATGWTRVSAQDGKVIRVSTTAGQTGGQDTHNYKLTWSGLGAVNSGDPVGRNTFFAGDNNAAASASHTHTAPAPTTSASITSLPPYVAPILGKANAETPTISVGFSAMFDGDPGGGWVVRSADTGTADKQIFNKQFLRPNTVWNGTSAGRDNETLPSADADTSAAVGNVDSWNFALGGGSPVTHTHTLTATFNNSTDVLPPYFNVVVAEKVNFIFNHYAWYEDSGTANPTNRWGAFDLGQNASIPSTPRAYTQPDLTTQLRLRVQINVLGNSLLANQAQFKVQYKQGDAGITSNCIDGTWVDVDVGGSGTAAWRYGTSGVTDGSAISTSLITPTSNVLQQYVKSSSGPTNPNPVDLGQTMEYDFHLQNNAAFGATKYYFRILESNDTLLSQYSAPGGCPSVSTVPQTAQQMKHGLFFIDGAKGSFSWAD